MKKQPEILPRSMPEQAGSRNRPALRFTGSCFSPMAPAPSRALGGVLILGDHRQSVTVARSLRRAGYRIIAGRQGRRSVLERSRSVSEVWEHPPMRDRTAWEAALEAFCEQRTDVGIVFPVGDREIELTVPLSPTLPVLVVAASPTILAVCRSKRALLALAERAGIPTFPWEAVASPTALVAAVERVGLPAVLKPDQPAEDVLGYKAIVIRRESEAWRVAQTSVFPSCGFVLQRLAVGARHNLYFAAHEGRLLGYAQLRIMRTDRPDGTGLAVEGLSVPPHSALVAWTEALTRSLSYTGIGCAQYMVDESTASACFLEINARLGANCAAACACGLDLPRLFIESLLGVARQQPPARVGRRYAWLEGDLQGLAFCLSSRSIGWRAAAMWLARASLAQLRAHDQVIWSWRDPMPSLAILGPLLRGALRRAMHERRRT